MNNKKYFITYGTQTESQLSKRQPTTTNLKREINNFSKIQEFMDPSQPLKPILSCHMPKISGYCYNIELNSRIRPTTYLTSHQCDHKQQSIRDSMRQDELQNAYQNISLLSRLLYFVKLCIIMPKYPVPAQYPRFSIMSTW